MFIVFEGGEGSGKSTMIERVKAVFADKNIVYTRDPGGTKLGERIREVVLSDASKGMDVMTEILLFHAARAQLVAEVILPALRDKKTVICNRFELSGVAYQIYGREREDLLTYLKTLSAPIIQECMPDYTIYLDVNPEIGLDRAKKRDEKLTRFDKEKIAFHQRVRAGYKKHLGDYGKPMTIDSNRPLEELWTDLENTLQSIL